ACGSRLPVACPNCHKLIPPDDKFCAHCGVSLPGATHGSARAPVQDGPLGERRHVTVLFSDLVNSTAIAAGFRPEEAAELSAEYLRAGSNAVACYGGHVAKYLGDGLLVYFGYPEAHENGPERAVRAGLTMLEAIEALNRCANDDKKRLAVRIG